jgi:hypothetical protein
MEFYYQRTAKTTGSPAAKKQKPAASSAKLSKSILPLLTVNTNFDCYY